MPLTRWFGRPELNEAGLRWARPASHPQRGLVRSGLLFMTVDRLGFAPRGIDVLFGARPQSWELTAITAIKLKPTLRKLRVTVTTDSGRYRFILTDAAVVFNDLRAWRARQEVGNTPAEAQGGAST